MENIESWEISHAAVGEWFWSISSSHLNPLTRKHSPNFNFTPSISIRTIPYNNQRDWVHTKLLHSCMASGIVFIIFLMRLQTFVRPSPQYYISGRFHFSHFLFLASSCTPYSFHSPRDCDTGLVVICIKVIVCKKNCIALMGKSICTFCPFHSFTQPSFFTLFISVLMKFLRSRKKTLRFNHYYFLAAAKPPFSHKNEWLPNSLHMQKPFRMRNRTVCLEFSINFALSVKVCLSHFYTHRKSPNFPFFCCRYHPLISLQ